LKHQDIFQSDNSFSQPTLTVGLAETYCFTSLVMQPKEKPTDIVASSLNFESFPGKHYFSIQDTMVKELLFAR